MAIAGLVDALVFLPQVIGPVLVEVAAGVQGAELEDGLGALQPVPPEYSIDTLTCRYWPHAWRCDGWLAGCS